MNSVELCQDEFPLLTAARCIFRLRHMSPVWLTVIANHAVVGANERGERGGRAMEALWWACGMYICMYSVLGEWYPHRGSEQGSRWHLVAGEKRIIVDDSTRIARMNICVRVRENRYASRVTLAFLQSINFFFCSLPLASVLIFDLGAKFRLPDRLVCPPTKLSTSSRIDSWCPVSLVLQVAPCNARQ